MACKCGGILATKAEVLLYPTVRDILNRDGGQSFYMPRLSFIIRRAIREVREQAMNDDRSDRKQQGNSQQSSGGLKRRDVLLSASSLLALSAVSGTPSPAQAELNEYKPGTTFPGDGPHDRRVGARVAGAGARQAGRAQRAFHRARRHRASASSAASARRSTRRTSTGWRRTACSTPTCTPRRCARRRAPAS